jgi:hypothetical protein
LAEETAEAFVVEPSATGEGSEPVEVEANSGAVEDLKVGSSEALVREEEEVVGLGAAAMAAAKAKAGATVDSEVDEGLGKEVETALEAFRAAATVRDSMEVAVELGAVVMDSETAVA